MKGGPKLSLRPFLHRALQLYIIISALLDRMKKYVLKSGLLTMDNDLPTSD